MWLASHFIHICLYLLSVDYLLCENLHLNQWAVEIKGGKNAADGIAEELGFENTGQIGSLKNFYLFIHHNIEKRSTTPSHHHHQVKALYSHPSIRFAEQQISKKRVKRGYLETNAVVNSHMGVSYSVVSDYDPNFNDTLYPDQWYLHHGASERGDMGVLTAWQKGYTGKNVVVTILDDGLERTHSDIAGNYDPRASYDINSSDYDPTPRYDTNDENRHGTRCAGEVAAVANNTMCGVGIAYNAQIGGVRMLDGEVSDSVEAHSLSMNPDYIQIYSASWGPDDNGKVVDGPASLAWRAFKEGVAKGRRGLGSIFVWASGNGGSEDDSCNCDGYTNSIYTLSISSVSEHNRKPWYLEECSSTMASTYSSGATYVEKQIVTTDIRNRCTKTHTGTSASAPLAAGICALALEANPALTWRDMQYITLMTADPYHVRNDGPWVTNGLGRKVSLRYGYGIMDAGAMVSLAERWTTVPEQHICTTDILDRKKEITGEKTSFYATTNACQGGHQEIKYLEHVQARISLQYSHRGNLRIYLVSPNGTRSTLLPKRRKDFSRGTFDNWPFMSVHFWGENPRGRWTLDLENPDASSDSGMFGGWQLVMYGTATNPVNVRDPVRKSAESRLRPIVCDSECADEHACTGPDPEDCTKCKYFRRGLQGPCVRDCSVHEFADPVTGLCVPCHSSCWTCQGPDENDCIDCSKGIYLIQSQGQCTGRCPDGYFADDDVGVCNQCWYPCGTCVGSANHCTSCPRGLTLARSGQCLHRCLDEPGEAAAYLNAAGECRPCSTSCQACAGPSANDCLSCPTSQVLHAGMCLSTCPPSYFRKNDKCLLCFRTCTSCSNEGPADCISCSKGYVLSQSHCISSGKCSPGLYFDTSLRSCTLCDHSCETCDGASSWECTSCHAGYVYHPATRQCKRCCTDVNACTPGMSVCTTHTQLSTVLNTSINTKTYSSKRFGENLTIMAVLSCLFAVVAFAIIFGLLQAKSEGYLCFKRKISYQALDALYNDRIMLADDDFTDEEDIFVSDNNDKGAVHFVANDEQSPLAR